MTLVESHIRTNEAFLGGINQVKAPSVKKDGEIVANVERYVPRTFSDPRGL